MLSNDDAADRNNQEGRNNENPVNGDEFNVVLAVIKIIILAIFMAPLAEYSVRTRNGTNQTENDQIQNLTIDETTQNSLQNLTENFLNNEVETNSVIKKPKIRIQEPTCPRSYIIVILEEICEELIEKSAFCIPEDFNNIEKHKIPKRLVRNTSKIEAKVPTIVNYAVGIILMTSLGAALLELYKAKRQPEKKDGKNSLSRKCSLADLTVMKHQRKEMVRRESLLEVPEENLYTKQLDHKPTPLHRQCSFPVGPSSSSVPILGSPIPRRRLSMQTTRFVPVVDGRPAAVLEGGRRHSIVSDGRQQLIVETRGISLDGRGMSLVRMALEDSPERRYHGRGRRAHRH